MKLLCDTYSALVMLAWLYNNDKMFWLHITKQSTL
jgi:hypothetical protein